MLMTRRARGTEIVLLGHSMAPAATPKPIRSYHCSWRSRYPSKNGTRATKPKHGNEAGPPRIPSANAYRRQDRHGRGRCHVCQNAVVKHEEVSGHRLNAQLREGGGEEGRQQHIGGHSGNPAGRHRRCLAGSCAADGAAAPL